MLSVSRAHAFTGSGTGVSGDPYLITSCAELMELDGDANHLSAHYQLTASLDCISEGDGMNLAEPFAPFSGVFNGDGNTVSIALTYSGTNQGLFGATSNATIENLTVSGTISTPAPQAGLLIGSAYGNLTLSNVHSNGSVYSSDSGQVGGLIGNLDCDSASITGSSSSATVTGNGYSVGGLIGYANCTDGDLTNVSATGDVTGGSNTGGLLGDGSNLNITDSYATGNVIGDGNNVGGLVGYASNTESFGGGGDDDGPGGDFENSSFTSLNEEGATLILHSYASGDVSGDGPVGGLVGSMHDEFVISQSYATGDVSNNSSSSSLFGGLVGSLPQNSSIHNSYARGDIAHSDGGDSSGGGLVGSNRGKVFNSYSTGSVSGVDSAGGLAGSNYGSLYGSAWDTDTSGASIGCSEDAGTCDVHGHTTADMKTQATFSNLGWTVPGVWELSASNDGYPSLTGGEHELVSIPLPAYIPVESVLADNQFVGGGTAQGLQEDDATISYMIPFTFTFFEEEYTEIFLSSNGFLSFSADSDDYYDFDIEDGANGAPIIVPISGDLATDCDNAGEDIYITDNDDGRVIVRWQTADLNTCDNIMNFEVVLNSDSTFQIHYGDFTQDVDLSGVNGSSGVHSGKDFFKKSVYSSQVALSNVNSTLWTWEESEVTVDAPAVDDTEGVTKEIEDAGPNDGDANGDGMKDSTQDNVGSSVNPVTEKYAVIEAPTGTTLSGVSFLNVTTLATQDPDTAYPVGLASFTADCGSNGCSAPITITYDQEYDTSNWVFKKFQNDAYTDISSIVTYGTASVGGTTVTTVTYTLTDGGAYDADGIANGIIVDPAGPSVAALSATGSAAVISLLAGTAVLGLATSLVYATKKRVIQIPVRFL